MSTLEGTTIPQHTTTLIHKTAVRTLNMEDLTRASTSWTLLPTTFLQLTITLMFCRLSILKLTIRLLQFRIVVLNFLVNVLRFTIAVLSFQLSVLHLLLTVLLFTLSVLWLPISLLHFPLSDLQFQPTDPRSYQLAGSSEQWAKKIIPVTAGTILIQNSKIVSRLLDYSTNDIWRLNP